MKLVYLIARKYYIKKEQENFSYLVKVEQLQNIQKTVGMEHGLESLK